MTTKVNFSDSPCCSFVVASSWKVSGSLGCKNISTQTPDSFYKFSETETQTGLCTEILQSQVTEKQSGINLLDHLTNLKSDRSVSEWKNSITNGCVTVDCEVVVDPSLKLENEFFVEFVNIKQDAETQTMSFNSDVDVKSQESRSLSDFMANAYKILERELNENVGSKAFDGYELLDENMAEDITYWKLLSVDLEKKKVIFPDWTTAKHCAGKITRCVLTRNKERIYDIDYDDGVKLLGVREEHIRLVEDHSSSSKPKSRSEKKANIRLQEGVRVHAKVVFKGGVVKYLPGRVVKCSRNGTFDIECEGGRHETGLPIDDLLIGLDEGLSVEARRPTKVQLQCTGISWNSTGSTVAASYGREDIVGWCDFPGAVCLWNVFGKNFASDNPDFVLDHSSCLMCVKCHPTLPAIVAAGSFNGEVVVWDLTTPEQPLALSPIFEYAHKEPVMDLEWVPDAARGDWLLVSAGADGKVLFWSLSNGLRNPIKGASLSIPGRGGKSSKRQYPSFHGASALSFTGAGASSASAATSSFSGARSHAKWIVVGQEGGSLVRAQTSRLIGGNALSPDSFKSLPTVEEVYPPLKRGDELFSHESHIGPVNSLDCSPYHRNLFLSGGGDGSLKLFHMLEKAPLRQWDPVPPPGTPGVTSTFAAITCVRFSPTRPLVFAASSADGFLYLFDLFASPSGPVAILEALTVPPTASPASSSGNGAGGAGSSSGEGRGRGQAAQQGGMRRRVGITSISFNRRQRDLLAACDYSGRVHVWRLSWRLSNRFQGEQTILDDLVNASQIKDIE